MAFEEMEGGAGEPPLLFQGDGLGGFSGSAGLHLDEDDAISVSGDEVDLAERRPIASGEDPESLAPEVARRGALPGVAERPVQQGAKKAVHGSRFGPITERPGISRCRALRNSSRPRVASC